MGRVKGQMEVFLEEGTHAQKTGGKKIHRGRRVMMSERTGSRHTQLRTWESIRGEGGGNKKQFISKHMTLICSHFESSSVCRLPSILSQYAEFLEKN